MSMSVEQFLSLSDAEQLQKAGIFFVKELNAQKARLKLLIALNAGLTGQALKDYMEG